MQKTIKKTTVVNPDGTKNITEETFDGVNVERKNYMIGTDSKNNNIYSSISDLFFF